MNDQVEGTDNLPLTYHSFQHHLTARQSHTAGLFHFCSSLVYRKSGIRKCELGIEKSETCNMKPEKRSHLHILDIPDKKSVMNQYV